MNRDDLVLRAKLAEQAERYEDMADSMKQVVNMGMMFLFHVFPVPLLSINNMRRKIMNILSHLAFPVFL